MSVVVALVGVPGAGKSTIGHALAEHLGVGFTDSDELIELRAARSVSDIFIDDGEEAFRAMEREVVADVLGSADGVLALGGGAVLDAGTRELLSAVPTVWLTVDSDTAVKRVGLNAPRPMLLGNVRGQLKALAEVRKPFYTEVATATIDTTDQTPEQVCVAIIETLGLTPTTKD